jgi:hypothetical protein
MYVAIICFALLSGHDDGTCDDFFVRIRCMFYLYMLDLHIFDLYKLDQRIFDLYIFDIYMLIERIER